MKRLKYSRILITQNDLYSINGSVVIVLELAKYLISIGVEVVVYTYFLRDPVKSIFEENKIRVIDTDPDINLTDFDLIWVHQQVLPLGLIKDLGNLSGRESPVFVFNHMSSLDHIADEFPYVWNLENKLSSLSLFNSEETQGVQVQTLDEKIPKKLYQNPAPDEYVSIPAKDVTNLSRILVVSNHPPEEVNDLRDILYKQDIKVDFLGDVSGGSTLIKSDFLTSYDLIVTIGKTVQNCLVGGIPVYVYDHFGGPGFLSEGNFSLAEKNNFSGRGFSKKTAGELAEDIVSKYAGSIIYTLQNRGEFIKRYSIKSLVNDILHTVEPRTFQKLDQRYVKYLEYTHNYSREHRMAARYRVVLEKELVEMSNRFGIVEQELQDLKNSKSLKLANFLAYPIRRLKEKRQNVR